MSTDYKWMSNGGLLLDGSGDIAITSTPLETTIAMVRTRLKSAIDGWKLYKIGAGLDQFPGNTSNDEIELTIRRQVLNAISSSYLPANVFTVGTIRIGGEIQIFVHIQNTLVAQAVVTINTTNTVG